MFCKDYCFPKTSNIKLVELFQALSNQKTMLSSYNNFNFDKAKSFKNNKNCFVLATLLLDLMEVLFFHDFIVSTVFKIIFTSNIKIIKRLKQSFEKNYIFSLKFKLLKKFPTKIK